MRRAGAVLVVLALMTALLPSSRSHDLADHRGDPAPVVLEGVPFGDLQRIYFVVLNPVFHHNSWRCQITAGCTWPEDSVYGDAFSSVAKKMADWTLGWRRESYVEKLDLANERFGSGDIVVSLCYMNPPTVGAGCNHSPTPPGWEFMGSQHYIHRDGDRAIIAAVCISDIEGFMADNAAALSYAELDPAALPDPDPLAGWDTTSSSAKETLGRGWSVDPARPRIAVYDHSIDWGGTASWSTDGTGKNRVLHLHGFEFWLDKAPVGALSFPGGYSDSSSRQIFSHAMSDEEAGSCWSDPVVVDDSVPWMAATVCQRASDFNLKVGNTDTYPWVDATGKPWYRALDHASTPEATRLYRPLDWALLGFEEWEPLADAAVAAGLVWAVWPDDPDDPAYDSTGRSYADYGGKPVCILANG